MIKQYTTILIDMYGVILKESKGCFLAYARDELGKEAYDRVEVVKEPVQFLIVRCQVQKRERLRFLQESDDLQQSFLCRWEHRHIYVTRTEHENDIAEWMAERC